ncbi:MAG: YbaB/EbfC family nucleoid-associated protein [Acidobacteriota bacterium]
MKSPFDLNQLMKKAKEMQEKMQKELEEIKVEGSSGGGMVQVEMNGSKHVVSIKIEKDVVNPEEIEMLQDLIVAAMNDAYQKVEKEISSKLGALGLNIPGLFNV